MGISSYGVSMTTLEEVRNRTVKFAGVARLEMINCFVKCKSFAKVFYILKITCVFSEQVCPFICDNNKSKTFPLLIIMKQKHVLCAYVIHGISCKIDNKAGNYGQKVIYAFK
jgi:hypothetical protein